MRERELEGGREGGRGRGPGEEGAEDVLRLRHNCVASPDQLKHYIMTEQASVSWWACQACLYVCFFGVDKTSPLLPQHLAAARCIWRAR